MKALRILSFSLIASTVLLSLQCQTAVEPSNIVPDGGFHATVKVVDQGNNPIDGARVQWVISNRGATQAQIDSAFNAGSGSQSALSGSAGSPGIASFQIPVPIAQAGVMVLFKTTPPAGSDFLGVQKNGNVRIDTLTVCGETFLTIVLQRTVQVKCNGATNCKDVVVTIEPPVTTRDTVSEGDFIQTDGPITISSVSGVPGNFNGIGISTSIFNVNNGAVSAVPATIAQNTPYRIRFDVNAGTSSAAVDTVFVVTVTATQNGSPCWVCVFNLRVIVKQQTNCQCPTTGMHFSMGPDTSCINQLRLDTLKNINLSNTSADCSLQLMLDHAQLSEPVSEVWVSEMNSTLGDQILLQSGATLSTVTVSFQPQSSRTYNQKFVFVMYRLSTTGQRTKCDSTLTILFKGVGGNPTFAVDTASSTIFKNNGFGVVSDTLIQCTLHPNPTTGARRLCLRNDGTCTLNVNLSVVKSANVFTLDSSTLNIPPHSVQCVGVNFKPSNSDVYTNGRCANPQLDFSGLISATSNYGSAIVPVVGKAQPDISCAGKAELVSPKFGAKDANNITYYITLDILADNTVTNGEQANGLTDSVKIFVKDITTTGGPPNDANITGATLSTGQFQKVKFFKVANLLSLPADICSLFNTYGCPTPTNALNDQPVIEGDVLIFEYKGLYGIMWIKKLAWSDHSANALPQVEGLVCYPFN